MTFVLFLADPGIYTVKTETARICCLTVPVFHSYYRVCQKFSKIRGSTNPAINRISTGLRGLQPRLWAIPGDFPTFIQHEQTPGLQHEDCGFKKDMDSS